MYLDAVLLKKVLLIRRKLAVTNFLVEKKSPLVQPPDYDELPIPSEANNIVTNEEEKVKKLISQQNQQNEDDSSTKSVDQSFEDSLIKKIKKN